MSSRGVGAELAALRQERDDAVHVTRVRMYDEHLAVLAEVWHSPRLQEHINWMEGDLFLAKDEAKWLAWERDDALADLAKMRAQLTALEDFVAEVDLTPNEVDAELRAEGLDPDKDDVVDIEEGRLQRPGG